jgi:hypothetical protein
MPGCKDISACNYDDNAEVDDGSCIYSIGDCVENIIDKWYLSRDLESGWNMFGYGCPSPIDVAEYLSSYTDNIIIAKDNNGAVYIPEWGFNGIGDFTPGFGYQIKLTEAIEGFSLCDWYASDLVDGGVTNIENENIILNSNNSNLLDSLVITQSINTDLQQDIELTILQNNILLVLVQSLNQVLEENVLLQDSLIANIVSLQDENASLQEQNQILLDSILVLNQEPLYQVGDFAEGGIVFYVDETGQHGLVCANQNINYYDGWGCNETSITGADSQEVGAGLQNSIDIISSCDETPIPASECLNYENAGYTDWYLPSFGELLLMYDNVGNGAEIGNIGEFGEYYYWSSSEGLNNDAWGVSFYQGDINVAPKYAPRRVRPIRSF